MLLYIHLNTIRTTLLAKSFLFVLLITLFAYETALADNVPIGMYGTWGKNSKYYMTVLKDAGFQVVVSSQVEYASKLGLKCLYPLWLTKDIANDPVKWDCFLIQLRRTVEKYKANKTIMGWYVTDEPEWVNIPTAKIKVATDIIKSIDPNTPTFVVLAMPDAWSKYLPYFDIIAIDPYLEKKYMNRERNTSKVTNWIRRLKSELNLLRLNKPIWVVLGAFDLKGKKPDFRSHYIKPSPSEFESMFDLALKENIDGILVFSLTILEDKKLHEWNLIRDDPALWETVKKLPSKLQKNVAPRQ